MSKNPFSSIIDFFKGRTRRNDQNATVSAEHSAHRHYDIAAYVWPSYTGKDDRARIFWPGGEGEWQTVRRATPKFKGHTQPRIPQLGYLDEADPRTMEKEIDLATSHGVNVFIYDWYWYDGRPFLETCLNDGFLKAKNRNKMRFYLMWANHDANYTWDKRNSDHSDTVVWQGAVDRTQFDIIVDRVIAKYFSQPNYYCIDGRPVFSIYEIDSLIKGLGGFEATKAALADFRARTRAAGFADLHLQFILMGNHRHNLSGVDGGSMNSGQLATALGFDSTTNYQFAHFTYMGRDYNSIVSDAVRHWDSFANVGLPYYPHVSLGWDNNPRFFGLRHGIVKNNTPDNVRHAFELARDFADRQGVNLITVNSWNEWTETSYLLPDNVNGTGYLEAIRSVFLPEK